MSQVKIVVRRAVCQDPPNPQSSTILKNLDAFLIRSFEKAVSLETDANGASHSDTMERQLDLSKVYQANRDLDRAYETASKVYNLALNSFGTENSLVLRCKHQQLQVSMELEQLWEKPSLKEILNSFQTLYAQLKETLGPYHKDTLRCYHDVGYVLFHGGKTEESLKILEVVLTKMQEHLGRHATLTQRTANNVANALYALRRLDEVDAVLSSIPEVRKASRPIPTIEIEACHPYTFDALEILALSLCSKKDFDRSVAMHERAIKGRKALFGQYDPTLFNFARNLGLVFEWQRHYEKAEDHYKNWLHIAKNKGMESQINYMQKALDDHLKRWAAAVERGDLVREDAEESFLEKSKIWRSSKFVVFWMIGLLLSFSLCYLLRTIIFS